MEAPPSRLRMVGLVSLALAVVLVPFALYFLTVLEPQQRHMRERNVRVLQESADELERKIGRLTPLIQFSLVPKGKTSDSVDLTADTESAPEPERDPASGRREASGRTAADPVGGAGSGPSPEAKDRIAAVTEQIIALGERRSGYAGEISSLEEQIGREGSTAKLQKKASRERAEIYRRQKGSSEAQKGYATSEQELSRRMAALDRVRGLSRLVAQLDARVEALEVERTALEAMKAVAEPGADELSTSNDEAVGESPQEQLASYLEGLRETPEYRSIYIDSTGDGSGKATCTLEEPPQTAVALRATPSAVEVVASGCRPPLAGERSEAECPDGGTKGCIEKVGVPVVVTVPLSDLAVPLDEAAMSAFDQLIIVGAEGETLHASSGGPIVAADRLQEVLSSAATASTAKRLARLIAATGATSGEQAMAAAIENILPEARKASLEVELNGVWYRVFAQPMNSQEASSKSAGDPGGPAGEVGSGTQADSKSERRPWYVVGIVDDARFRRDSVASSLTQLFVAISGLVLLLLAWPWLRLLLSGSRDRLSVRHVLELIASIGLGVAVLVLLVSTVVSGSVMQRRLDETARAVAERMSREFRMEIGESIESLRDARRRICVPAGDDGRARGIQGSLGWPTRDGAAVYPPFDLAFVLDSSGNQIGKQANYRTGKVSPIRVPSRAYFQRIRDGEHWTLTDGDGLAEPFFLERIKTYDHGWLLTAVSAPLVPAEIIGTSCERGDPVASALTRRFDSLTNAVLPPEYGFAVVRDSDGLVMYHSDDSRSLIENFFAETGFDYRIETLIRLRRGETLDGRYRREGFHRLTIHPLDGIPWTLVVFRSTGLFDVLRFEMMIATGAHLLLFVFGLLLVGFAVTAFAPGTGGSWFWPDRDRTQQSARAALFVTLVGAHQLLALQWLSGGALLWTVLTLPPLAVGAAYLALHAGGGWRRGRLVAWSGVAIGVVGAIGVLYALFTSPGGSFWNATIVLLSTALVFLAALWLRSRSQAVVLAGSGKVRLAYMALISSMLFAVIVVPSLAIIKDTHRAQLDRLTRHGERAVVAAALEREAGLWTNASRLDPDSFGGRALRELVRPKRAECRGMYVRDSLFIDPGPVAAENRRDLCVVEPASEEGCAAAVHPYAGAFSAPLTLRLPALASGSFELRQLFDGGASDGSECWLSGVNSLGPGETPMEEYRRGSMQIRSPLLPLPFPDDTSEWLTALGGAGMIAGLAISMLWLFGTRVVGLGMVDPMGIEEKPDLGRDPQPGEGPLIDDILLDCDRLVLFPRPDWESDLEYHAKQVGWSVRRVDATAVGTPWVDSDATGRRLLIVEDLHRALIAPKQRVEALAALREALGIEGQRLIVSSDVDPLDPLRTSTALSWVSGEAQDGDSSEEEIQRRLEIERLELGSLLARLRPTKIAWRPGPVSKQTDPRSAEVLRNECDWTPWLEGIRDEIAADPRVQSGAAAERQIVQWVADRAEPLYRRIWALLPAEDRLALIQLAQGDLLNPRNTATIRRLVGQGLVLRDPSFRPVSRGFALFAQKAERPSRVREWERGAASGSWSLWRVPLMMVLLVIFGFAVYAGRDTVDATVALIPALAAGFPAVVRLLGALRSAVASSDGGGGSAVG